MPRHQTQQFKNKLANTTNTFPYPKSKPNKKSNSLMNKQKKPTVKSKNLYKYKNETLLKELDGLVEDILLPFQDSEASKKNIYNKNLNIAYSENDNSEFDLLTHRFENEIENSENQEQGLNKQQFFNNPEEVLDRDYDSTINQLLKFSVKE
ncbi:3882_t:CDS:1 [Dentiscutata heterogama]|uniref:3882_t:CDS:1 n=1 Tax=Dentiscutata heterogama TaxID=1316150 RepID=A0ACA9NVC4_9GLOM|nr:3882_t:CDS:1 [Dentiscutata heterogama]